MTRSTFAVSLRQQQNSQSDHVDQRYPVNDRVHVQAVRRFGPVLAFTPHGTVSDGTSEMAERKLKSKITQAHEI